ncbi:enoyl-CoA hydratase/isomerase family protein [Variovorax sp.]|jgi:2-(1,2-epoxy-1,2-dihydrophenyl)acetyl-CoA isomerase|uniref:enoyl-CoA hydratase/isomerase family protein n=1 Tax=Variovorax sp. TaxID=1871043 RepID=UPI000C64FF23|nr:enoyl-CoA hydratase/isomerase family protein [Variovorax sp.]MBS77766.1 enoyl-CoA hydratase [Variovorax sp.]
MTDFVLRERHGATLLIRINRPERRNAFDLEVRQGLADAVIEARDDDTVRAVVITGTQGVFCAGGDLKSLSEAKRPVFKDRERIRRLHTWFHELVNLEKPVIAAVDGPAFGAGFNLALACDFVVASERARFCAVFGRIGLVPDLGGFFLLPRIVGLQRAKDLVFSAREMQVDEAMHMGIVFRKVAHERLEQDALELAARYHAASTEALGIAKNILNRSFNLDQNTLAELESSAQALALHTEYHDEAVGNFLAKRGLSFDGSIKP